SSPGLRPEESDRHSGSRPFRRRGGPRRVSRCEPLVAPPRRTYAPAARRRLWAARGRASLSSRDADRYRRAAARPDARSVSRRHTGPASPRMSRQLLFVQGGGAGAHDEWDDKLVDSLKRELGPNVEIRYPRMPSEDDPSYAAWSAALWKEVASL